MAVRPQYSTNAEGYTSAVPTTVVISERIESRENYTWVDSKLPLVGGMEADAIRIRRMHDDVRRFLALVITRAFVDTLDQQSPYVPPPIEGYVIHAARSESTCTATRAGLALSSMIRE